MNKQIEIEEIKKVLIRTCKRVRTPQEDYIQDRYAEALYNKGYRRQDEVAFEVIDKFRDELINIFIDMCGGNDYSEINLLQIGDAIDALYDSYIAELKKKYGVTEDEQASTD